MDQEGGPAGLICGKCPELLGSPNVSKLLTLNYMGVNVRHFVSWCGFSASVSWCGVAGRASRPIDGVMGLVGQNFRAFCMSLESSGLAAQRDKRTEERSIPIARDVVHVS